MTLKREKKHGFCPGCSSFGAIVPAKRGENTRSLRFGFKTVLQKLLQAPGTDEPKDMTAGCCDFWQLGYFLGAL